MSLPGISKSNKHQNFYECSGTEREIHLNNQDGNKKNGATKAMPARECLNFLCLLHAFVLNPTTTESKGSAITGMNKKTCCKSIEAIT